MSQPNSTVVLKNMETPINELNQFFGVAISPYSTKEGVFPFGYEVIVSGAVGSTVHEIDRFSGVEYFSCQVCGFPFFFCGP